MTLNLPPKDAKDVAKDDANAKSEAKPKPTSTAALSARLAKVEKQLAHLCDSYYGANVRPELSDDESEEDGE